MAIKYVDLADIKTYCNVASSNTNYDSFLETSENEAAKVVEKMLGYDILIAETVTTYIFDEFKATIVLPCFPLAEVVVANDTTTLVLDKDYTVDATAGIVFNLKGIIRNRRKIKVSCKFGYTQTLIPSDVKKAVKILVRMEWYDSPQGHNLFAKDATEREDSSFSIDRSIVRKQVEKLLGPYKAKRVI